MKDAEIDSTDVTVPDDFPRDPFPAALTGAQPEVTARLIDGEYIVGLMDEERRARFLMCKDLIKQLADYAERKRTERIDMNLPALLDAIDLSVRKKGWGVAGIELDWIMGRVRARFH